MRPVCKWKFCGTHDTLAYISKIENDEAGRALVIHASQGNELRMSNRVDPCLFALWIISIWDQALFPSLVILNMPSSQFYLLSDACHTGLGDVFGFILTAFLEHASSARLAHHLGCDKPSRADLPRGSCFVFPSWAQTSRILLDKLKEALLCLWWKVFSL